MSEVWHCMDLTMLKLGAKPPSGLSLGRSAYKTKSHQPHAHFLQPYHLLATGTFQIAPIIAGTAFHLTMATAFNFTRRRFIALASAIPALLLLTRCATLHRRDGYDDRTYTGPFFSDGSHFVE